MESAIDITLNFSAGAIVVHAALNTAQLDRIEAALSTVVQQGASLMGKIEDFVTAQTAHNASVSASLDDLSGDIDNLNAQIAALTGAAGTLTADQQAALDALTATGQALDDKASALAAKTPPVAPAP